MPPIPTTRPSAAPDFRKARMLSLNTPVEDHLAAYGLWVKREDLACPPPGPPFSKTRGVYARVASRPERVIGVLDTYHSQAGHAVARACQVLGKKCINFYPEFKHEPGPRDPQLRAAALGAELVPLKAGRSAILWHAARKATEAAGGYMMPNALKLEESVTETAKEVPAGRWDLVVVPASSATIAAGVVRGFLTRGVALIPTVVIHLGYSRSHDEVRRYVRASADPAGLLADDRWWNSLRIVDEGYGYKDKARPGPTPPWPCNPYYDLKAFRWWTREKTDKNGEVLFWNVG